MPSALVFDGKVVQIEDTAFPVAPGLTWVDITGSSPEPEVGWSYDSVTFTAPPPLPAPETDKQRAARFLKDDPVWRASVKREVVQRRAAGETTLTVQGVIDEYTAELP